MTICTGGRSAAGRDVDLGLLALVEEPYASVADVRERLGELLSALRAREDRRADFLSVYVRTTEAVADRIERGRFADPDWVGDYLVAFANHYREAVLAHETGHVEHLPAAWRVAFRVADRGDASVLRTAALGVNAHVNHDLALALDDVGVAADRDARRADHRAVTEVIADLAPDVRETLLARDDGDAPAPAAEQVATVIGGCRRRAWQTAVALDARQGPRRRLERWANAATATAGARVLRDAPLANLLDELAVDGSRPTGEDPGPERSVAAGRRAAPSAGTTPTGSSAGGVHGD
jgi:hypothetical protein